MRKAGMIMIILGVMAFIGSLPSNQPVEGFVMGLLMLGGIGSLLLYASGAQNRKYRRLGEQTNTYYEQIQAHPPREPAAPVQQPAGRVAPPPAPRSQSLEAGLFDE